MKRSLSVALLSAFLLLTDWTNSQTQAPQSQLSPSGAPASGNKPVPATTRVFGVVKDARGGVITKAVVTLTGDSSKYSKQTKTTGNGTYVFEGIPVGTYAVTIAKEGFHPFSSTANVAESQKTVAVNATLSLASKPPVVFLRQIPGGGLPGGPDRGAGSPCDPDGITAINSKVSELLSHGIQLGAVIRTAAALDNIGKYRQFANENYIFWSPITCARFIHGAIYQKWNRIGREFSDLGYPVSDETDMYDGRGHYNKFFRFVPGTLGVAYPLGTLSPAGFIVWTSATDAHVLQGAIAHKWWELVERGRVGGFFPGYPVTDEQGNPGVVRWNHFEDGSIFWTPQTGAHEIHGAIRDKWFDLNGPSSWLGAPVSDEKLRPDGKTPYSLFQNGIIVFTQIDNGFGARELPLADDYFSYTALDLRSKQRIDLGRPVSYRFFGPQITNFQLYLEKDNLIHNSIERHADGSIYVAYTPRSSPYWYDTYKPNENGERVSDVDNAISFGHFGLPQPQNECRSYQTPVPNLRLNYDYSTDTPNPDEYGLEIYNWGMWDANCRLLPELKQKNVVVSSWPKHDLALRDGWLPAPKWFAFTPRQGAATPPERIPGDLPPYGIPRTTQAFIGNRGAYCDYMDIASVRRQDECTVPCSNPCPPFFSPDGADIWVPPEWQTILPVNPNNILDTSLGTKTYRGEILTGRRVKQLAQQEPLIAADITEFSGRPVRHDYCSQTIGWMSSDLEGLVTNSFLSGGDYSGSHVGFPWTNFILGPNFDDRPNNPNYWLGYTMPRWFDACTAFPTPADATDSNCDDWVVYVQPDPEYYFLQLTNPEKDDGNFNDEHKGSLENEIDQWILPIGFRPEPGERIYMTGRWIVDCGHHDWHGELHPIESYVSSHLEKVAATQRPNALGGVQAVAKVVVTGDWAAYPNQPAGTWEGIYPLKLNVWPPARPTASAILHFEKVVPPQGSFGLLVNDSLLPGNGPNHVEVLVQTPTLEAGFPRTHDYNQVYDPPDGVRLGRRLAAIYYLWWEEPPNPTSDVEPFRPTKQ